eukprot:scaffold30739_cov35-Attheya_sp.AAC.1
MRVPYMLVQSWTDFDAKSSSVLLPLFWVLAAQLNKNLRKKIPVPYARLRKPGRGRLLLDIIMSTDYYARPFGMKYGLLEDIG